MKILIIEDESPAAKQLISILNKIGNIDEIEITDSIKSTINWFKNNKQPDIVFMDIHIADGSAFKIFEYTDITCPIIFTTAFDEYAVNAFKVNSVDYILKPITLEAVEKAFQKLEQLKGANKMSNEITSIIREMSREKSYKTHFLVPVKGNKMIPLLASEIAYFFIEEGTVFAKTFDQNSFNLEYTLDELANKLDPKDFYRANRQFIISRNSIKDVDFWFNSRLSINLKVLVSEKILISRTKVTEFKEWYSGK